MDRLDWLMPSAGPSEQSYLPTPPVCTVRDLNPGRRAKLEASHAR